jgi:protein N-terminal methyltransferase
VEASTEGVLGGYGCVNDVDVKGSDAFLRPLLAERFSRAKRRLVALGKLGSARNVLLLLLSV